MIPEFLREVGTHVKVEKNLHSHSYTIGKIYVVTRADDDGTLRAKDIDTGAEGNWLRWTEISLVEKVCL
jgi:hypothetical protein